jgi:hypothetical protein
MVRPTNLLASVSSALLLVAQHAYSQATVNQQDLGLASGVLVQLGSSSASSFCTAYLGAPRTPVSLVSGTQLTRYCAEESVRIIDRYGYGSGCCHIRLDDSFVRMAPA